MVPSSEEPATHHDEHLKSAKDLLVTWRYNTWMEEYADRVPYGASALLPDVIIDKIASSRRLTVPGDLAVLGWSESRARRHGEDVLKRLRDLDAVMDANRKLVGCSATSTTKRPKEKRSSQPTRPCTSQSVSDPLRLPPSMILRPLTTRNASSVTSASLVTSVSPMSPMSPMSPVSPTMGSCTIDNPFIVQSQAFPSPTGYHTISTDLHLGRTYLQPSPHPESHRFQRLPPLLIPHQFGVFQHM
ncbi:hypothetical protein SCLCIDRAFT_1214963 [Scleroderma citrinum Foug A]|uniref:Uncharacterized protein n=1 Tax=Scleroderma citrinum Foug A TaxID=1036808 RepID=A0A0C3ACM2_9AGAM|nr:hypothetical protein SCLCIDRAFT_1214963 [Scleroderma citrinum Foug A]